MICRHRRSCFSSCPITFYFFPGSQELGCPFNFLTFPPHLSYSSSSHHCSVLMQYSLYPSIHPSSLFSALHHSFSDTFYLLHPPAFLSVLVLRPPLLHLVLNVFSSSSLPPSAPFPSVVTAHQTYQCIVHY